eukprot:317407_1
MSPSFNIFNNCENPSKWVENFNFTYNHFKSYCTCHIEEQLRETRQDLDAATGEIKILKRTGKHRISPSTTNLNERKIKQVHREIYNIKPRVKMAMSDLDKEAKYYES